MEDVDLEAMEEPRAVTMDRTDDALVALRQILRATEISARSLAKASGLSPSQHIVLQLLSKKGCLTPGTIAKEMSLSQATVTSLIDKLEAKSLLRRTKDDKDRRRSLVALTSDGEALLDRSPAILQERFETRFRKLEEWEKSFIVAALERVASILDAEDIDAAPVLDVGPLGETPNGSSPHR
ncbi:MAG: MarR family transcriptional regulator [Pseudomonadota bacterium]